MRRREFLALTARLAPLLAATTGPFSLGRDAHAAGASGRVVVNVMLLGGADFRYVFVPHPAHDPAYVDAFWSARRSLYTAGYADYPTMFDAEYQDVADPRTGLRLGVHRSCGWLASQLTAGRVAVIANMIGSDNRRHDHSQIIVDTGDPRARADDTARDGWGGRLVEATTGEDNIVVVSDQVSLFSQGSDASDRLRRVVHARDMRDFALPGEDPGLPAADGRNVMARALQAYYQGRGQEVLGTSATPGQAYRRFFGHYASLRQFGDAVAARLATRPLPAPLAGLALNNPGFALQCRNLYDTLVSADLMNPAAISMSYGGWDTHVGQQYRLNRNLGDVFGVGGGLATAWSQIEADMPAAAASVVLNFGTDFGRQLAANGSAGTDHGRGNCGVLIGKAVRGGIYGELFPEREARPDPEDALGRTPFAIPGTDVLGRTSFERVLASLAEWAAPGSGLRVFPGASSSALEQGVSLSQLLAA